MKDEVFGELSFSYGWNGKHFIELNGKMYPLFIKISADSESDISDSQRNAFKEYLNHEHDIWKNALILILDYYLSDIEEYRSMYEDEADDYAPYISTPDDLLSIIKPQGLFLPSKSTKMDLGILLTCTWDEEAGIGLRVKNGKIIEVGSQDIAL